MVKKLTEAQVKELQACKHIRGGNEKFYDIIEEIYKDDAETMAEIKKCRDIFDSLDWVVSYPAHEKTKNMYYQYMDDLLAKIGYHKE